MVMSCSKACSCREVEFLLTRIALKDLPTPPLLRHTPRQAFVFEQRAIQQVKMFPPVGGSDIDVAAISGILGFTSIVAWIVVFTPQIYENFSRSSALGLSVEFVIIWLVGDIFNILGAVLQNVLPTMIILAVYYTLADIVLLGQCFYYKGFVWRDVVEEPTASETSPLLRANDRPVLTAADAEPGSRARSPASFRERLTSIDATHLSPAAVWHPQPAEDQLVKKKEPRSMLKSAIYTEHL